MALNKELLITLQQLSGFGPKTILNLAESIIEDLISISDLCAYWERLKGAKFEAVTSSDLINANKLALRIINKSKELNIGVLGYYDPEFPQILRECINEKGKLDPPLILYFRGDIKILERPAIAIIGTREPTPNGVKAGIHISKHFAENNFNIVSGLAVGCDSAGHRGALLGEGVTTAFLANGLDWESIYPKENLELAKEIVDNGGLLLSEYSVGQSCGRYSLVARDRLQAGLAYATIVVQTGEKGGTMHAVNATLLTKKPLFMVKYKHPEDINNEKVQGNVKLINEGKALPLSSDTLEDSVRIIDQYIDNRNQLKSSDKLFV